MKDDASNELDFTNPKIDWHRPAVPPARPPAGANEVASSATPEPGETTIFQAGELASLLARADKEPAPDTAIASAAVTPPRSVPADQPASVTHGAASVVALIEWPSGATTPFSTRLNIGRDHTFCPVAGEMTQETHVSRRHAVLEVCGDGVRVCDLGSRNGTFVDGVPVRAGQAVLVENNAQIRFGPRCVVPLTVRRPQ